MKILITGICGFAGSSLALALRERLENAEVFGIDNLSRPGSEMNRARLRAVSIKVFHGDLRQPSDLDPLPAADWVIDGAANPSALAGVDGKSSSRQLLEHNLWTVVNTLEYCRARNAGIVVLSSSRVYSIPALAALPVLPQGGAFRLDPSQPLASGVSPRGIAEHFSTAPPVSLYGATKLAAETVALEYGAAFGFPVYVDRCGVLAGAGQFGTAEQGIFSYWIHAHARRRPLRYIGFGGHGWQVRDAFHPGDLCDLILAQMRGGGAAGSITNAGGGIANSMSLAQLTAWCDQRFGPMEPQPDHRERPFDVPWLVMDGTAAQQRFGWCPKRTLESILEEIAAHASENPDWLDRCEAT